MNSRYDSTPTSSDSQLCLASPEAQKIFCRTTFDDPDFSSFTTTNYHPPSSIKYPQNPRKKRTKMINLDNPHPISNPKYAKKPDPSAPKITRPCSECGKKFWSWKALFGHMRCHPERQWRGINPPPNFKKPHGGGRGCSDTSSWDDLGSRMTDEDLHVATCLLMLANAHIPACDQTPTIISTTAATSVGLSDPCMGLRDVGGGVSGYKCSSYKKVFGSHQALGGHKASHKNVKGCFTNTRTEGEEDVVLQEIGGDHERKSDGEGRMDLINSSTHLGLGTCTVNLMPLSTHQCGVCLRVFSSGQGLGGHKRCHWEKLGDEMVNAGGSSSITQGLNVGSFGLSACGLELDALSSSASYSSNLSLDLRLGHC